MGHSGRRALPARDAEDPAVEDMSERALFARNRHAEEESGMMADVRSAMTRATMYS